MKKLITVLSFFLAISFAASAQLQLDKQLQMTGGTDADRRITNVGSPGAPNDAVNAVSLQTGALTYAAASGSGGNYVVALTPAPAAYAAGMIVNFKANHSNTGAATLKVGALAAVTIKTGVTNDLSAGDIAANQMVSVIFDGTNFQLLSGGTSVTTLPPSGPAGGDLSGTYPNPDIAADAVTTHEIANGTIAATDLANTGVTAGVYNNVTVNAQGQVTSASNVSYLTTEGDGSVTNEGALTVGAGTGTTSLLQSNTSGSTNVTFSAGTGITLGEPGSNTISITNASPDQTVAITGAGINVVTGTYPNFTITGTEVDGSITNEGALSVGAGSSTTSLIQSNTSGSGTVTLTAGTGLSTGEAGNVITLALANTAVTPGTYTSVTVNQQGQVTGGTNPNFPTGTGSNGYVTYWTGTNTQSYDSDGAFYWDASNNSLGIGTASPSTSILSLYRTGSTPTLQLYSNRAASSQLMENRILFGGSTNGGWSTPNGAGIDFRVNYPTDGLSARLNLWTYPNTSADPVLTIWDGNLGISNTSPAAKLHISHTTAIPGIHVVGGASGVDMARFQRNQGAAGIVGINSSGGNPQVYFNKEVANSTWAMGVSSFSSDNSFSIAANGSVGTTDYFVIRRTNGNVGIGTTVPAEKLDVVGSIRIDAGGMLRLRTASSNERGYVQAAESGVNGGAGLIFATSGGENISFKNGGVTGTEYMVISGAGNVGIGTTGPAEKLHVNGNIRVSGLANPGVRSVYADSDGKLIAGTATDWRLVDFSDFQSGTDNWSLASGTMVRAQVNGMGTLTGNWLYHCYGQSGNPIIQKQIDLSNYPHSYVKIRFNFWFIDSWDQSVERGLIYISTDGVSWTNVWSKGWHVGASGGNIMGNGSYGEAEVNEDAIYQHNNNTLYVRFTSTGIGGGTDETWGFDNVEIYVR